MKRNWNSWLGRKWVGWSRNEIEKRKVFWMLYWVRSVTGNMAWGLQRWSPWGRVRTVNRRSCSLADRNGNGPKVYPNIVSVKDSRILRHDTFGDHLTEYFTLLWHFIRWWQQTRSKRWQFLAERDDLTSHENSIFVTSNLPFFLFKNTQ
jgi:hypothetical protein